MASRAPDDDGLAEIEEHFPPVHSRTVVRRPRHEEISEHRLTHLPYRAWCDECVAGRGVARPHRRHAAVDPDTSEIERVVFDWAFLRDAEGGELLNVLVGVDHRTSTKVTIIAEDRRGNNMKTVDDALACLRRMGHFGRLELRTDGEPAIQDLMAEIAARRPGPTTLQRTPPYDSQSNGRIERSVRSIEELARVMKLDLERRVSHRLSVHTAAFAWLLRHVTMLLNFRQSGTDGRTCHERMHGRPYRGELMCFGSPVQLKRDNSVDGGVMAARWVHGFWMGKSHSSDEHIVWLADGSGMRCARTVQSRDVELTYDQLLGITEWPGAQRLRGQARRGELRVRRPQEPAAGNPPRARDEARRWQITREVFQEYGATPGCSKCEDWTRNTRSSRSHSNICRARLERILRNHPCFGPRIADSAVRTAPREPQGAVVEPPVREDPPPEEQPEEAAPEPIEPMDVDDPGGVDQNPPADEMRDELMGLAADRNEEADPEFIQDWATDQREARQMDGVTPDLIGTAKAAELAQLRARCTFDITARSELNPETKMVGTRWVLGNKGTAEAPRVKARLVCQEFATYRDMDLFSGTPGLAAVKFILAELAQNTADRCLMLLDITGAFLYGSMRRNVAIRLPSEAGCGPGVVGVLRKSLYGLRDAPQI